MNDGNRGQRGPVIRLWGRFGGWRGLSLQECSDILLELS
jgi:hypothetical protein